MTGMRRTTFKLTRMDCPSEERMVRMELDGAPNIGSMEFDLHNRLLHVIHTDDAQRILRRLDKLKLDASIRSDIVFDGPEPRDATDHQAERRTLWLVLVINAGFFALESVTGILSRSMGLLADSLDMLADAIVYGLALLAVGGTLSMKRRVARCAGYAQVALALFGLLEVLRRFIGAEEAPEYRTMMVVASLALAANILCLYLLQRRKSEEAHMKASMLFTSNDIIINLGVVLAGALVMWLDSPLPDLVIGGIVFIIVARGAYRILSLAR